MMIDSTTNSAYLIRTALMNDIDQHTDEHADGIVEDRKQAPPLYFNILLYGLIIWGVLFMAYFLLSGWSSQQEFEQKMKTHQQQTTAK
jgi:cytochrome c oxidase cbb3-type subunit 3